MYMYHPLDGITLIDLGSPWISHGIFLARHSALWSHLLWPQLGLHFSSSHIPFSCIPLANYSAAPGEVIFLFFQAVSCVKEPSSPTYSSQLVLESFNTLIAAFVTQRTMLQLCRGPVVVSPQFSHERLCAHAL